MSKATGKPEHGDHMKVEQEGRVPVITAENVLALTNPHRWQAWMPKTSIQAYAVSGPLVIQKGDDHETIEEGRHGYLTIRPDGEPEFMDKSDLEETHTPVKGLIRSSGREVPQRLRRTPPEQHDDETP